METKSAITEFREAHEMSLEAFGGLLMPRVHKSTVLRWERFGVPPDRVVEVERATKIDRGKLRPDLFGRLVNPEAAE